MEGGGGVEILLLLSPPATETGWTRMRVFSYWMKYSLPYFFWHRIYFSFKMSLLYKTAANKQMNRAHVLVQSTTKENMYKRTLKLYYVNNLNWGMYGTTTRVGDWIQGLLSRRYYVNHRADALWNTDVIIFQNVKCIFPLWKRMEAWLYSSDLKWTRNIRRH